MYLLLVAVFALTAIVLMSVAYAIGLEEGNEGWLAELTKVRAEAAQAERQLHDLTREAFVAMAEETERQRGEQRR